MENEDKIRALLKEMKSYEKDIMKFNRDNQESDFVSAWVSPKEGIYLTIRCGIFGIKTYIDEFRNGQWQMNIADGSETIAFSRNQIKLKNYHEDS